MIALYYLADMTLEVARSKRCHVWVDVTGSADDEGPGWRDLPQEDVD
jgi:hypothetical protein